jgi:hypothetical protein
MSDTDDAPPNGGPPVKGSTCRGAEALAQSVVDRLAQRRSDLAAALNGRSLSVEVLVTPTLREPLRIGFGEGGLPTILSPSNPLTPAFTPDVVVRGPADQVLAVFTAPEPTPGSVRLRDPDVWPRYARVHRIIASELSGLE